jgi:hypothetical protein
MESLTVCALADLPTAREPDPGGHFCFFFGYCLEVTLKARLRRSASGMTPRAELGKVAKLQMLEIHPQASDGREMVLRRYTLPSPDVFLLLNQLKLKLPEQIPSQNPKTGKGQN